MLNGSKMPSRQTRSRSRASSNKSSRSRSKSRTSQKTVRVMTYNCRAFFDRYLERGPFLGETIAKQKPDLVAIQEAMVNNAGLDSNIKVHLEKTSKKTFTIMNDASTVTYLKNHGVPTKFPWVVAKIFVLIINTQMLLLKIPGLAWLTASMPLMLEIAREALGNLTNKFFGKKFDLFDWYYVSLAPFFGVSQIISNEFALKEYDVISLEPDLNKDHLGTCQRALISDREGNDLFWFVNIHYVHFSTEQGAQDRLGECERVLNWMEKAYKESKCNRGILLGDHNTLLENEPLIKACEMKGYVSAFKACNGAEPKSTWPSGIQSIFMDLDGLDINPQGACLDYIWLKNLTAVRSELVGDECKKGDKTLYASDHVGIWADVVMP